MPAVQRKPQVATVESIFIAVDKGPKTQYAPSALLSEIEIGQPQNEPSHIRVE